jgi:hypothetical protein
MWITATGCKHNQPTSIQVSLLQRTATCGADTFASHSNKTRLFLTVSLIHFSNYTHNVVQLLHSQDATQNDFNLTEQVSRFTNLAMVWMETKLYYVMWICRSSPQMYAKKTTQYCTDDDTLRAQKEW